jgi:hypothetical protein
MNNFCKYADYGAPHYVIFCCPLLHPVSCCLRRWRDSMSLNCGHQRAYLSIPQMIHEYGILVEWYWQVETQEIGEILVPVMLFSYGASAQIGPWPSHYEVSQSLLRRELGLLEEWSSRRKDLYLHTTTQHRTTKTNIYVPSVIQTHDPSGQAAKDLHFRPRCHRGRFQCQFNNHRYHVQLPVIEPGSL